LIVWTLFQAVLLLCIYTQLSIPLKSDRIRCVPTIFWHICREKRKCTAKKRKKWVVIEAYEALMGLRTRVTFSIATLFFFCYTCFSGKDIYILPLRVCATSPHNEKDCCKLDGKLLITNFYGRRDLFISF